MNFVVDNNKCVGCGKCVKDCVSFAITMKEGLPCKANFADKLCINCGHCQAICPNQAISLNSSSIDKPSISTETFDPSFSDKLELLLQSRRSCRQFKHENLPKETISRLLDVINYSPTGVNSRALQISVIDDVVVFDKIRNNVNTLLLEKIKNKTLPKEFNELRLMKPALEKGADIIFRNAPHMITIAVRKDAPCADIDGIIALSQFEMLAQALGVGTLWCGFAFNAFEHFASEYAHIFNFSEDYKIVYCMLFGKPEVSYPRIPERTPYTIKRVTI